MQGLIGKSRALSELEQSGVQWRGGCRQRDGGLGSPLRAVGESLKSAIESNAHLAPNGLQGLLGQGHSDQGARILCTREGGANRGSQGYHFLHTLQTEKTLGEISTRNLREGRGRGA